MEIALLLWYHVLFLMSMRQYGRVVSIVVWYVNLCGPAIAMGWFSPPSRHSWSPGLARKRLGPHFLASPQILGNLLLVCSWGPHCGGELGFGSNSAAPWLRHQVCFTSLLQKQEREEFFLFFQSLVPFWRFEKHISNVFKIQPFIFKN